MKSPTLIFVFSPFFFIKSFKILERDNSSSVILASGILEDIQALKFQYIDERDELEKRVSEMEAKEQRNLENEYWASQF